jgi:hypothetical protein
LSLPASIELSGGTLDAAVFEMVPFIRFQKSFSGPRKVSVDAEDLRTSATTHERTVWVVSAQHLDEFLSNIRETMHRGQYPWETALTTVDRTA